MMDLYPSDIYKQLEFEKIIELARHYCMGSAGDAHFSNLLFQIDFNVVTTKLNEVEEWKNSIALNEKIPFGQYDDIRDQIKMLQINGYVLEVADIASLKNILILCKKIFSFFSESKRSNYPSLYQLAHASQYDDQYLTRINKVMDDQGLVRNDASEALSKIRRLQISKKNEIDRTFDQVAHGFKSQGILTDNVESYRNGRRVLSVPAEHKRRIKGIIHDESATGKTVYIEPENLVILNNELFELEYEERREIYKIIKELCSHLASGMNYFLIWFDQIAYFDFVQAKAKLALDYKGRMPSINPTSGITVKNGVHPLLYLRLKGQGHEVVPYNVTLDAEHRILLISGPNAGGKSILMKSIGLQQLMVQSGFLVPCEVGSEFGIFYKIFSDIGDHQSLEEDLSTYSSHLTHMRYFTDHADPRTLVIIDEFGSGTDPDIGGAIAESILTNLNHKKVWGVVTTHYSILKLYAHNHEGVFNGSMLFNEEKLRPTFIFKSGNPGSSFAFELARNNKISDQIIRAAERKLGSKKYKVENLLNDLQRKKVEVEHELKGLEKKQKELDKLIKTYEQQSKDFEAKRQKMRLDLKEIQLNNVTREEQLLDQTLKDAIAQNNIEKIRALALQKKEEKLKVADHVNHLNKEVRSKHRKDIINKVAEIGDYVQIIQSGTKGHITDIKKDKVKVSTGTLTVEVPIEGIEIIREPVDLRVAKGVHSNLVERTSTISDKMDIRGLRYDEALSKLEDFLDKSLIAGGVKLKILHGKGSGVLKRAVRQKLKEYKFDMNISHPPAEEGGDGITIVEFL